MNIDTIDATAVGYYTLVGIYIDSYPIKTGNCFSLISEEKEYRIVNFAHENLTELLRRGLTYPIKIHILDKSVAIIHDDRIPDNWYKNEYCEVCCPEELLPIPQQLKHNRQETRGERKITEHNGSTWISIDTTKSPKF